MKELEYILFILVTTLVSCVNSAILERYFYFKINSIKEWQKKYNKVITFIDIKPRGLIIYFQILSGIYLLYFNNFNIDIDSKTVIILFSLSIPLVYNYTYAIVINPLCNNFMCKFLSILKLITSCLIFSFYPVVGGYILAFLVYSEMSKLNLFGLYSKSDKILPVFCLTTISSSILVYEIFTLLNYDPTFTKDIKIPIYFGIIITIFVCYVPCGIKKFKLSDKDFPDNILDWAKNDRLDFGALQYWARGSRIYKYFGLSDNYFKSQILPFLKRYGHMLNFCALLIEFPIFVLINFEVAIFSLISLFILHLMIFILSGIFFWKWMFCLIPFGIFFYQNKYCFNILNISHTLLTILLLTLILIFLYGRKTKPKLLPIALGWWYGNDVFVEKFKIKSDSSSFYLPGPFCKPYNMLFTFSRVFFEIFQINNKLPYITCHIEQKYVTQKKNISVGHLKNYRISDETSNDIIFLVDHYCKSIQKNKCLFAKIFLFLKPPSHIWIDYSLQKPLFKNQNYEVFHELSYFTFTDCMKEGYQINEQNYSFTKIT